MLLELVGDDEVMAVLDVVEDDELLVLVDVAEDDKLDDEGTLELDVMVLPLECPADNCEATGFQPGGPCHDTDDGRCPAAKLMVPVVVL